MVHALREAHRVLKAGGILIDLRPAAKHRRAGLSQGKSWRQVGVMQEEFDNDHAASRAVTEAMRAGLFRRKSRIEFDLDRVMDGMDDFRAWLDEFVAQGKLPPQEWLFKRLEAAYNQQITKTKIAVRGPMLLAVLSKR